eukprot:CCRYP_003112-RA/>CCRYP_003112-RA protein AED:0.36 eAED:0.36 QI:0/0/0/1/0/0/2/0/161
MFVQQVCGKFFFLGIVIDPTLLCSVSAIALQSASPTQDTLSHTLQLLDYLATQEDAVITYHASNMILAAHNIPPNNGAVSFIAHIIKHIVASATKVELAALIITEHETAYIDIILKELGHQQPTTPLQTDNAMAAEAVIGKIQPKCTKAMDMHFYWLRARK